MCGIAGIVESNSLNSTISLDLLKKMSDIIIHRGPDSDGKWISDDNKCGFSFRRLAIIDLSPLGNQPMMSNNGRYTIVFNGEIYNHQIIREELIRLGYHYRSGTDTETILNGYAEWGADILPKLVGMWAFAIWDNEKKELFFARDRIGIKPFYYHFKAGKFVFGSEIKSIFQHPDIKKELNYNELPIYLNYVMSGNESLFAGINKLAPGSYGTLNQKGDLKISKYWSPIEHTKEYTKLNEKEIQDEVMRLLRVAVKDRMMSDVPFGVFLSGGIDSSLNVALMAELMDRPIDTFTVGFKELEKYNELGYAKQISDLFKTNHKEILIDEKDCFDALHKINFHTDEPNGDPVCMPLYFLSKLTRDSGTTVIQVGEGSDEQFVGYKWMRREWEFYNSYWKMYDKMPKLFKKNFYALAKSPFKFLNRYAELEYLRRSSYDEELYWSGLPRISATHLEEFVLNSNKIDVFGASKFAKKMYQDLNSINSNADYLQKMIHLELTHRLAEILLMRVDKITMAHSLEARVPFLDHRFVEFTMSIPPDKRVPKNSETKHILKKAVEGILPNNIIYRKKQGFAAPVAEWFRKDWYNFAEDSILNTKFAKLDLFDKNYMKNILNVHKSGKKDYSPEIYQLLMLNLWYDKNF